jgi:FixJ family two-component response regulator
LSTFRVAVVEDDESFRESLEGLLQAAGYEVLPYRSAEDFLNSGCLPDITCLITDFSLPGMNGIDLIGAVHALRAEIPLILVTAHAEPHILSQARMAGARQVFKKPVDSSALLKAVAAAT